MMEIENHKFEWKPQEELECYGLQSDIEDEALTITENSEGEKVMGFKKGLGHFKLTKLKHYLKSIDGDSKNKEEKIRKLPNSVVVKLLEELDNIEKKNYK